MVLFLQFASIFLLRNIPDFILIEGASRDKFEIINTLPRDCIALVIFSFTSPRDLCSLATLSSVFRSMADLDELWEQFLPPNYQDILSRASTPVHFSSIKDLFFRLCDPILVDDGQKWKKTNGKVCYRSESMR
ncbi:F-box protein PP2-B3 [Zostera marina]|uniref:F-box protein PP2-B3 n=1 Tax=Zostera marina TaxID=29655 RepID=A0A0K9NZP3_ZOSMR|nr:F-box protein PP2-B3 [Zostera marina]